MATKRPPVTPSCAAGVLLCTAAWALFSGAASSVRSSSWPPLFGFSIPVLGEKWFILTCWNCFNIETHMLKCCNKVLRLKLLKRFKPPDGSRDSHGKTATMLCHHRPAAAHVDEEVHSPREQRPSRCLDQANYPFPLSFNTWHVLANPSMMRNKMVSKNGPIFATVQREPKKRPGPSVLPPQPGVASPTARDKWVSCELWPGTKLYQNSKGKLGDVKFWLSDFCWDMEFERTAKWNMTSLHFWSWRIVMFSTTKNWLQLQLQQQKLQKIRNFEVEVLQVRSH